MRLAGFGEACCFTFMGLAAIVFMVTILAPSLRVKRTKLFARASFTACIAFIPICSGVLLIVMSYRYGVFHYNSTDEIHDVTRQFLPPTARDFTIDSQYTHFRARYRISESDLEAFLDDSWKRDGHWSVEDRDHSPAHGRSPQEEIEIYFDGLNWPPLADAKQFEGPRARRGTGFTVWYSPEQGIAYELGSYW